MIELSYFRQFSVMALVVGVDITCMDSIFVGQMVGAAVRWELYRYHIHLL